MIEFAEHYQSANWLMYFILEHELQPVFVSINMQLQKKKKRELPLS